MSPTNGNNHQTGELSFCTSGTPYWGMHERMRIDYAGNVGIGTSAPGTRLALYGDDGVNTGMFEIYTKQVNTAAYQKIAYIGPTGSSVNDGWFQLLDNGTVKINMAANSSRGGDTYFNTGGNIGIGVADVAKPGELRNAGSQAPRPASEQARRRV